jgi:hypothetical protein
MSMKNSNDNIGNQIRDLQACSTVPQPTAALRTQEKGQCTVLIMYSSVIDGWAAIQLCVIYGR